MSEGKIVQHLPVPWGLYVTGDRDLWIQDANDRVVAVMVGQKHPQGMLANAEFLCLAANCHDELVAALEGLLTSAKTADYNAARAALAKARGGAT